MPTPMGWLLTLLPCQDPKVSSALQCLKASATDNPYTLALLAYVFGLAGHREQQQVQLQRLARHNVSAGTTRHGQWHLRPVSPSCLGHPIPPPWDPWSQGLSSHPLLSQGGSSTGR